MSEFSGRVQSGLARVSYIPAINGLPGVKLAAVTARSGKGHRTRLKPSARIDDFRYLRHDRDDQDDLVTIAVTVRRLQAAPTNEAIASKSLK